MVKYEWGSVLTSLRAGRTFENAQFKLAFGNITTSQHQQCLKLKVTNSRVIFFVWIQLTCQIRHLKRSCVSGRLTFNWILHYTTGFLCTVLGKQLVLLSHLTMFTSDDTVSSSYKEICLFCRCLFYRQMLGEWWELIMLPCPGLRWAEWEEAMQVQTTWWTTALVPIRTR